MPNARRTSRGNAAQVSRGSDELRLDGVIHNLRNIRQDPDASVPLAKAAEALALELEQETAMPRCDRDAGLGPD